MIKETLNFCSVTHHIEVNIGALVFRACIQRAVLTSETFPGSSEVISHYIDQIHVPWRDVREANRQIYQSRNLFPSKENFGPFPHMCLLC